MVVSGKPGKGQALQTCTVWLMQEQVVIGWAIIGCFLVMASNSMLHGTMVGCLFPCVGTLWGQHLSINKQLSGQWTLYYDNVGVCCFDCSLQFMTAWSLPCAPRMETEESGTAISLGAVHACDVTGNDKTFWGGFVLWGGWWC